ncbi:ribonuclease H-like domain-containing protein [Tanacetum coccineum]
MHYRLPHLGQGILGPAPAIYASKPTTLSSAFNTMPLQDPTLHMDTDAPSHLNFNASHSIIPSYHRPLHLHNVHGYLTHHILLRRDSSSDLYPGTKPSTSPTAFLSTSAFTWHQRLGHPGDQRSLYGLKQAPRAWFQRFAGYATRAGFYHSRCDSSLFIYRQGSQVAYLLIYMDDIILTASCLALLQQIIGSLNNRFDMTDLGALNYCVGISANRNPTGLFLSQKKYALHLLKRAYMVTCNPSQTPVDIESKLGPEGAPIQNPTLYCNLAGVPISYFYRSRFVLCSSGTLDLGLHLYASSTTSLVGYTDADWLGCPSTRMSTSGYCVFLGDNLLSWSAKRQHTLSRSSAEDEYQGVANVVAETAWLHNLFRELHSPLSNATLVYCDNVRVLHVPSRFQYADIFTKGLPSALFEEFRSSLSPVSTTYGMRGITHCLAMRRKLQRLVETIVNFVRMNLASLTVNNSSRVIEVNEKWGSYNNALSSVAATWD